MKNSLPPAWVEDIEKVEEDIAKIQLKGYTYVFIVYCHSSLFNRYFHENI